MKKILLIVIIFLLGCKKASTPNYDSYTFKQTFESILSYEKLYHFSGKDSAYSFIWHANNQITEYKNNPFTDSVSYSVMEGEHVAGNIGNPNTPLEFICTFALAVSSPPNGYPIHDQMTSSAITLTKVPGNQYATIGSIEVWF